jgi:hypothetical protein
MPHQMVQISNLKPDAVTALLSLASRIQSHLFWQKQFSHRWNERPGAAYIYPECQDNASRPLQIIAFQPYTDTDTGLEIDSPLNYQSQSEKWLTIPFLALVCFRNVTSVP